MSLKSRGKPGRPSTLETKRRRNAIVKNLAKGMSATAALVAAGYSKTSANSEGYRVIKHPEIQSKLTEAVARVLAEEKKQFEDIVRPYVRALDAKVIVRAPGVVAESKIPDHSVRMEAAAHLTKLYQPKNAEDEEKEAGKTGPPVVYQINFIEAGSKQPAPPVLVSSSPPSPAPQGAPPPVPRVSFVHGKR
ncbi:MAG: terminase small subunit [Alphaproteobacteria bacterium]